MRGPARWLGLLVTLGMLATACGGGGGGGGANAGPTEPPTATLPADLPIVSCVGSGPFMTTPCGTPIETMYAQVASFGPFSEGRATTVGVMDCANPREFPSGTPKPTDYFWMVRFAKDGTDYGGFVGTGGKLGLVCAPFTGE
jgi:hypothetical protein